MKLSLPGFKIEDELNGIEILCRLERAGRTCYKSEDRITEDSAEKFVRMLIDKGHESVLEHEKITIRFVVDRGVSHEIVRHRLASFSQESTRYCDYSGDVEFIIPPWCKNIRENGGIRDAKLMLSLQQYPNEYKWFCAMLMIDGMYREMRKDGWTPQQARSILPNSLKTEIVVSANLREWRLIMKQRTANAAHPQMREVMRPLLDRLKELVPVIFDDITYQNDVT